MRKWIWFGTAAVVLVLVLVLVGEPPIFRSRRGVSDRRPVSSFESTGGGQASVGPADAPDGFGFRVLDLADGRPVAGVRMRARRGTAVVNAESGPDGGVTFSLPDVTELSVDDSLWEAGPPDLNQPLETGIYWVYRRIEVQGVVRVRGDASGFDPRRAVIHVLVDGHDIPDGLPTPHILARLVEAACPSPGAPTEDGRFQVTVPRVHGLTIAATALGWKPARQKIDVTGARDRIELWLQRALRIRGVARSSDGTPLKRLPVSCLVLVKIPATEMTSGNLRLIKPEGGFTGSVDLVTGEAKAKFITIARTDDQGRFELTVPIDGETLVVAFPIGHRPVYRDLGVLGTDDVTGLDLVAERVTAPSWVRIVANGKPVDGEKLLIGDLSLKGGDAQPGVDVRLDAKGRIPADWLIPGHRFHFSIGRFSGHLVWDGRDTLDVAEDLLPVSDLPK